MNTIRKNIMQITSLLIFGLIYISTISISAADSNINHTLENNIIKLNSNVITDFVIVHIAKDGAIQGGYFMNRLDNSNFSLAYPLPEDRWDEYRFVYMTNEGQKESLWYNINSSDPNDVIVDPTPELNNLFPIKIINNTGKPDSHIYLTMIGRLADNENIIGHLNFDSSEMIPIKMSDNNPQTEVCFEYAIQLSSLHKDNEKSLFYVPHFVSGRLYISIDKPLPFKVNAEPASLAEPTAVVHDGDQPTASWNTIYDIVEMTWKPGQNLFVNTSNVDFFSIPFKIQMNLNDGTKIVRGYDLSRAEIISKAENIGLPLTDSIIKDENGNVLRLLAGTLATQLGIIPDNYLQPAIDSAWNNFKIIPINTNFEGWNVYGKVLQDNSLHITASHDHFGSQSFTIVKPTSFEAFGASGVLASGSIIEKKIQAFIAASINRGVFYDSNLWWNRSKYYQESSSNKGVYNKYAKLLHSVSIEGRCYAFSYDDVNGQDPSIWENNQKELIITIPKLTVNSLPEPQEQPIEENNQTGFYQHVENNIVNVTSSQITDFIIIHFAMNGNIQGGYFMNKNSNDSYSLPYPLPQSRWNEYRFVYMTNEGQKETEWFKLK
jgi:hypothetical protein